MPDVICIGEMLADFVPEGRGHILRPGGAPSNVAVNLSRLGVKTSVISKVGDDFLGGFLTDFARKNGVDVRYVTKAKGYKTGLVFVFLNKNKERDFSFYGSPSADTELSEKDIKQPFFKDVKVLHFGSISMMTPKSKAAVLRAIKTAKKAGALISYDPNYRQNLWKNRPSQARKLINSYFKYADIIKISDSELKFLFGAKPEEKATGRIFGRDKLVLVSAGRKGCYAGFGEWFVNVSGQKVKVVDTTGAGDAFMAGAICELIKPSIKGGTHTPSTSSGLNTRPLQERTGSVGGGYHPPRSNGGLECFIHANGDLLRICRTANVLGARAVGRKGAV